MVEVYDLECLKNLFTYTGYDYKSDRWNVFVISQWRNDYVQLMDHLKTLKVMIGYNNEAYDYPLLHHFINHFYEYGNDGLFIAQDLYKKSQEIIEMKFSTIADKNKFIFQIDLYLIWGYNNKARSCSLKDIEFAMRMDDVEEMPIKHYQWCKESDTDLILDYNKNDVLATYLFYKVTRGQTDFPQYKGKDKLALRLKLKEKFKLPCVNYPDIKIGEQLIAQLYSQKTGISKYELKKRGGTKRELICLKDCIPKWANFQTKEFNEVKEKFQSTCITSIKGSFDYSIMYHGIKLDYGTGGLHGCIKPGIYEANDETVIYDQDIGSLYPSIAIQLGIHPEHLGKQFLEIYDQDIVSVRLAEKKKPKKERDAVIMEGFKLAANSIYGKSGEENSILYDPLYTMKTTIGGQMFISLWIEKLTLAIPEIVFIQINTDGTSYIVSRKDIDKVHQVANEMTELTGLYIEDTIYKKFIVRDVNSYIGQYETGELKAKGCFEIIKDFHKDDSMRIVPIALEKYFIENIPVEETIKKHKNIYDFCLRLKTNSKSTPYYIYYEDNVTKKSELNRTTRYYISKKGGILIKDFGDGRITGVNVGYTVTVFNKYEKKDDYDIDYNFYITEANKIINVIDIKQLLLF